MSLRAIPWDAPAAPLEPARRARLGEAWRWRMEQEHLAVGAFAEIARELARTGADPVVLGLATRAAHDEARHADVCRQVAARHLGAAAVAAPFTGVPTFPERGASSAAERALLLVVEMCCLGETFTGAYFTFMLARSTDPFARAVVQSLLEDEIDHGRLGWGHLAWALPRGLGRFLGAALPALLLDAVKPVFDDARAAPEPDDAELEAHGWLGRDRGAAIYADALADVVLPGFETLGVDTGPARELAARERWLPLPAEAAPFRAS